MRENRLCSSYGEGLETDRDKTQIPRQSLTRQLLFRWVKGYLDIRYLAVKDANAVKIQLAVAVLTQLLLRLAKLVTRFDGTLWELLRKNRASINQHIFIGSQSSRWMPLETGYRRRKSIANTVAFMRDSSEQNQSNRAMSSALATGSSLAGGWRVSKKDDNIQLQEERTAGSNSSLVSIPTFSSEGSLWPDLVEKLLELIKSNKTEWDKIHTRNIRLSK